METLLEKKVPLITILSANSTCVLQFAQQHKIITLDDYNDLKQKYHTDRDIIINLLDMVINKGKRTSEKFVELIKNAELQEKFPDLENLIPPAPPALPEPLAIQRPPAPLVPSALPEPLALQRPPPHLTSSALPEPLALQRPPPHLTSSALPEPLALQRPPAHLALSALPEPLALQRPPVPQQDGPAQASNEIEEYKMTADPCGYCVIINNVDFTPYNEKNKNNQLSKREGSDKDKESLIKVFHWLGFTVFEYRDQTAEQMRNILRTYGQVTHVADCFVCCILSHGCAEGVYGTDGGIISSKDMFGPFSGTSCLSLANKPKAFFIQACRGRDIQSLVNVADNMGMEIEEEGKLELDVRQMITIPDDADFFEARSTVEGFASLRNTLSGTWFIQSLCSYLEEFCPKGEDILHIMIRVNKEVSRKYTELEIDGIRVPFKQMPSQTTTLTKKLVFRVPAKSTAPL